LHPAWKHLTNASGTEGKRRDSCPTRKYLLHPARKHLTNASGLKDKKKGFVCNIEVSYLFRRDKRRGILSNMEVSCLWNKSRHMCPTWEPPLKNFVNSPL
jgi:hypothetical protein